jgi:hypothetical protein
MRFQLKRLSGEEGREGGEGGWREKGGGKEFRKFLFPL